MGTLLVQRDPYAGAKWRLGIQWLGDHAWFWDRLDGGDWVRSGYHGSGSVHGSTSGDDVEPGPDVTGVREPRTPTSPAGSTAVAVQHPN